MKARRGRSSLVKAGGKSATASHAPSSPGQPTTDKPPSQPGPAPAPAATSPAPAPAPAPPPGEPAKPPLPPSAQKPLATEIPVLLGPVKKHTVYVVTIDNTTGAPVKIESLDEATGKRKELSLQQYAQALISSGMVSLPGSAFSLSAGMSSYAFALPFSAGLSGYASPYAAEGDPTLQAYYQGMIDYLTATASRK